MLHCILTAGLHDSQQVAFMSDNVACVFRSDKVRRISCFRFAVELVDLAFQSSAENYDALNRTVLWRTVLT